MTNGFSKVLRELARHSILWPLLAVVALVFATLGGGLLLLAFADGSWPARGALALLLFASADAVLREVRARGVGAVTAVLTALWLLAAAFALGALKLGLF